MQDLPKSLLKKAVLIRRFEELLLSLYSTGLLNGTVHTCIGQEWSGIALAEATTEEDFIVSNHRGHGHFLARTADVRGLLAEIMGRSSGVCGGIGGTQHLYAKNYLSSGIQGGMVPIATGIAFANKLKGSNAVSVACIGDGTLGEGIIYESFNIAAKWDLPLVVLLENNRYAQSTSSATTFAGDIKARAAGFGLEYRKANTWDPAELIIEVKGAVDFTRLRSKPLLIEIETDRLKAHSKGDDNRSPDEVKGYVARDYLSSLIAAQNPEIQLMIGEVDKQLASALEEAKSAPFCEYHPKNHKPNQMPSWGHQQRAEVGRRIADLSSEAIDQLFSSDPSTVMIGEDISGPYGGAFKITKNLSEKYPARVKNTPISEAAIVGIGTGLALLGFRPMVEIMFGDFTTLIFDQLHQHACKFTTMYGRDLAVPLVVRTPMGGRRGYGPTHSQSVEKFFQGIPGLNILAFNNRLDPKSIYTNLTKLNCPTLLIENKVLYTEKPKQEVSSGYDVFESAEDFPCIRLTPKAPLKPDLTIFCYGGMLSECEKALDKLFIEQELVAEIICPTQIQPLNIGPVLDSVRRTGRLVSVEEGTGVGGFGAEVLSRLSELGAAPKFKRVSYDDIIPSSFQAEMTLLPSADKILKACLEVSRE